MTSVPQPDPYEPPQIEARESIIATLAPVGSVPLLSAVFRPTMAYEPPQIERRVPIDVPLIGLGSPLRSAVFRPTTAYKRPRIVERTAIDVPLVAVVSGPTDGFSAAFRPLVPPGECLHTTKDYDPPKIERRDSIGDPLIATAIGSG